MVNTINAPQPPVCSIVIPSKNGGDLFHKALDAWAKQTLWQQCELIIVDSGSQDGTVEVAKQAGAKVFEIAPEQFNHGATRDYAISQASSEYIILTVQDAIPIDKTLLETLVLALQEPKIAGAYTRQIPHLDADILTKRNLNTWLTGRTEREQRFILHDGWYESLTAMEKYLFCNFDNVCSAIKKSVWQQQPFGRSSFGEDIDWAERVLKQGYHIVYEPQACVIHSHQRPMSYEYKRTYICHRKLYALFGLHLVPTLKSVLRNWLFATIADTLYILRDNAHWQQKIAMLIKVPILNGLNIYAQYQAELQGVNNTVKGV